MDDDSIAYTDLAGQVTHCADAGERHRQAGQPLCRINTPQRQWNNSAGRKLIPIAGRPDRLLTLLGEFAAELPCDALYASTMGLKEMSDRQETQVPSPKIVAVSNRPIKQVNAIVPRPWRGQRNAPHYRR